MYINPNRDIIFKNIWGKKWFYFSFCIILLTGIAILINEKTGDKTPKYDNISESKQEINYAKKYIDSITPTHKDSSGLEKSGSNGIMQVADSTIQNNQKTYTIIQVKNDSILIKHDHHLFDTTVTLIKISDETTNESHVDSEDSLVRYDTTVNNNYTIEFWKSIVNFRGYKLKNDKLVLYGINHDKPIGLIRHDYNIYMKYDTFYYYLKEASGFSPFNILTDSVLLHHFNTNF